MTPLNKIAISHELLHTLVQQGVMFAEALPAYLARLEQDPLQKVLSGAQIQQLLQLLQAVPLDNMQDAAYQPMTFGVLDEKLKPDSCSTKIDLTALLGDEHDD